MVYTQFVPHLLKGIFHNSAFPAWIQTHTLLLTVSGEGGEFFQHHLQKAFCETPRPPPSPPPPPPSPVRSNSLAESKHRGTQVVNAFGVQEKKSSGVESALSPPAPRGGGERERKDRVNVNTTWCLCVHVRTSWLANCSQLTD